MRFLSIGLKGINLLCGLMNIEQGIYTYNFYAYMENIHVTSKALYNLQLVTKKAVEEEEKRTLANKRSTENLTVSDESTWKKRRFNLFFRVSALVELYSKKVLHVVIKLSYC